MRGWRVLVAVGFLAGCARFHGAPTPPPVVSGVQVGVASWYGPGFHGNRTANGEIYDQYEITAAHPSLPLGTRAMVTNLANGRSVEVRINDRGPFVDGRVLDLSYGAARVLDVVRPGTARVRIEVLGTASRVAAARPTFVPLPVNDPPRTHYLVEVAALTDPSRADHLRGVLSQRFPDVRVDRLSTGWTRYYTVAMGPFPLRNAALARGEAVNRLGYPAVIREETP